MHKKAFTVTELTLILGMGVLATGALTAGLHRVRMMARMALCQSNVDVQMKTLTTLREEGETITPIFQGQMLLPQTWVDRLAQYGCTRRTIQCPSNERLQRNSKLIQDLQGARPQTRSPWVSTSYFFMPEAVSLRDQASQATNSPRIQIALGASSDRTSWVESPSHSEQVVDHVLSNSKHQYHQLTARAWSRVNDTTNHRYASQTPSGGYVGFVDGHVQWRPYRLMQKRQAVPTNLIDNIQENQQIPNSKNFEDTWLWW